MSLGKTFDWGRFIKLAERLHPGNEHEGHEAELRSSVSRAYYGAYCIARNFAKSKNVVLDTEKYGTKHIALQEYFKSHQDIEYKAIGNNLEKLRNARNSADYDDVLSSDVRSGARKGNYLVYASDVDQFVNQLS